VLAVLKDYRIITSRICIEITETMAMTQVGVYKKNIRKLKNAGCLIALDDFGIEYSTLSQLENIEFDIIKIDRSFTNTIEESYVTKTIVDMIQKIIKQLGKKCIVEGIETKEQMEFMLGLGFEEMQGYYFSRPVQIAN
jgi:EAL domain-containing protein (putative c-di-GMP-specific phosphodiesterase class I)